MSVDMSKLRQTRPDPKIIPSHPKSHFDEPDYPFDEPDKFDPTWPLIKAVITLPAFCFLVFCFHKITMFQSV